MHEDEDKRMKMKRRRKTNIRHRRTTFTPNRPSMQKMRTKRNIRSGGRIEGIVGGCGLRRDRRQTNKRRQTNPFPHIPASGSV